MPVFSSREFISVINRDTNSRALFNRNKVRAPRKVNRVVKVVASSRKDNFAEETRKENLWFQGKLINKGNPIASRRFSSLLFLRLTISPNNFPT